MKGGYLLLGEPEVVGIHQLWREQSLSAPVPTAPHNNSSLIPTDPTRKAPGIV